MRNTQTTVAPQQGSMVKQSFDATQTEISADVGSSALAAQAEAEVKARWAIANRNPRDWDSVRAELMKECKRPAFAATARYAKPVGNQKVYGPSIRFVEVALRCMGNVYCPVTVISDSPTERRIQVMVTDLESNISWPRQITVQKTVERQDPKGRQIISERLNSYGKMTYLVIATEDELANKEAAAISKAIRQSGLRVIPGDLQDEAMAMCVDVQQRADKADPNAAKKKVIDAFGEIGITPLMLKEYLGHPIENLQPAELQDLREIHAAIRDGESKWADVMELKRATPETVIAPAAPTPAQASAPAASTPPTAVTQPVPAPLQTSAQATQPQAPAQFEQVAVPAAPPGTPPSLTPPEQELEKALAAAQKASDVARLITKINGVPDGRKPYWREQFNLRMEQLNAGKGQQ